MTAYINPTEQFNRYRYANSNPFRFADPDGRQARPGSSEQYLEDYIPPPPPVSSEQPIVDLEPIQVRGEKGLLPASAGTDAKAFLLAYGYGSEQSIQINPRFFREGLGIGGGVGPSKGAMGAAKLCFVRERSGGCE